MYSSFAFVQYIIEDITTFARVVRILVILDTVLSIIYTSRFLIALMMVFCKVIFLTTIASVCSTDVKRSHTLMRVLLARTRTSRKVLVV